MRLKTKTPKSLNESDIVTYKPTPCLLFSDNQDEFPPERKRVRLQSSDRNLLAFWWDCVPTGCPLD